VGGDSYHVYVTTDEVYLAGVEPKAIAELEKILNERRNLSEIFSAAQQWYEIEYAKLLSLVEQVRENPQEVFK